MRLSVVLALLLAVPGRSSAVAPTCRRSCRTLQTNCIAFAHTALSAARAVCIGADAAARTCRKGASGTYRKGRTACRRLAREKCRPCCRLGGPNACAMGAGRSLPASPQSPGDPDRGRRILLNGDYMSCGIPYKLWQQAGLRPLIAGGFGGKVDAARIADREGANADLPYFLNTFTSTEGVQVLNANCLMCHGGSFDGQLIVGLGNATANFTQGAGGVAGGVPLNDIVLNALGLDDAEKAELRKIAGRAAVLAPQTMMPTIGMNPAEMLAVILMVHHDRDTLAWSDVPVTPLVIKDHDGRPIENPLVTSDPPPWWRVHKKNALFYNGMARGDHRGTMALATSVCVDDVARARAVDAEFADMQAFIGSIRAPAYPRTVDPGLVAAGGEIFRRDCGGCHGTYAARDEDESYPNLLIPLDVVGTDPVVAEAGVVHAPQLVAWYNGSFYGGITHMEPNDPFPGYMPPPLDGVWATAPYLHNGSVPTVELVLDSRARPTYWKRIDLNSANFDEQALGWPWEAVASPDAVPAGERNLVYDTTRWSQSNAGHPFGDHLSATERRAVIEYLKTL